MLLYKTIRKQAEAEQIIERSRFIAYAKPVETREEAEAFLAEIRAKHRDATHNVPAFVIGDKMQLQWVSDDGEPQGTSGAPIVQMLVREEITNLAVVVTRYFGGIKLGTGGLVRAYTSSAKLAVEAAGIAEARERSTVEVRMDYSALPKLQNLAAHSRDDGEPARFDIANVAYAENVTVTITSEPEDTESIKDMIVNLTSGNAEFVSENISKNFFTIDR